MKTPRSLGRLLCALTMGLLGLSAGQSYADTVITSVPYTISVAGRYTLNSNLLSTSTTVPAITISAPNVTLDLNGFYVAGPGNTAATNSTTDVVIKVGNVANVTIRNGTVAGNAFGIEFAATTAANSRNYLVDTVTVTRCYLCGVYFVNNIGAPGSLVRNCLVSLIGNSTAGSIGPVGILPQGGVRVESNNIGSLTATGTGKKSYGILAAATDLCIGNTISSCDVGIQGSKFLNNLTTSVGTAFVGGTNATGNN